MSWLAGIAGKAEELLNKVDQAAAVSLNTSTQEDGASHDNRPATLDPNVSHAKSLSSVGLGPQSIQNNISSSSSVPSNLNKMNAGPPENYLSQTSRSSLSVSQNSGSKTNLANKKDQDDELFEFLNSTQKSENGKSPNGRPRTLLKKEHSRHSSNSSIGSINRKTPENISGPGTPGGTSNPSPDASIDIEHVQMTHEGSSGYHSNPDDNVAHQQLSSLELENSLLKNEVSSLNHEMTSVIKRAKAAEEEITKIKKQYASQSSSQSKSDQIIRELRARENDLTEALNAKDSQLGILRVRFEEADKEAKAKENSIATLQKERDRVLQDHSTSSDVQNHVLDTMKQKLTDMEVMLQREQESSRLIQQESMQRQSKYEGDQQSLAESLNTAQRKLNEEKTRINELNSQLKTAKSQSEEARQELHDYKEKAARILQSKDKLISSLKEGTAFDGAGESNISSAELEECKQERDMYREEVHKSRMTIESLRTEIQDLEMQIQSDSETTQDQIQSLEEQLNTEKQRREDLEQENNRQKQELRYAHEELVKQKTEYKNRVQERDAEIEKLRNQLTTKSYSTTSQVELENRLHALTDSLIQKQTMLEALSTEKNSLGLQLERLEQQYKDVQVTAVRANATHVTMNTDDDEVRQRVPTFMRESPLDGDVARKVKRAANSIDKFSIRLGVFLRRYPIARVFVIVYMVILHFWVMIVLLTYKPEMHEPDYLPLPPGQQAPHHS